MGTYEELIPQADLVINLTPDKQHSDVVRTVQPLMKDGAALGYSHGFNIVEVGEQIRKGYHRSDGCAEMPRHRSA
ncbi:ketol-acid reductoisomerase [Escherichia coli]|uniref:Ketol-acid reductoisomerase n=1 Tax=Escherichia coli TaxID=562 RepID=A0A377C9W4_ECOLX|nr:ketol-acid reductoisomerase [Escherichia coli]